MHNCIWTGGFPVNLKTTPHKLERLAWSKPKFPCEDRFTLYSAVYRKGMKMS